MNHQTRRLQYFFTGQNFSDGVRITVSILLPAVLLGQWGHFDMGLTISTGAVCVSVTDTPGPATHRRNGMLAALGLVGITATLPMLDGPVMALMQRTIDLFASTR